MEEYLTSSAEGCCQRRLVAVCERRYKIPFLHAMSVLITKVFS